MFKVGVVMNPISEINYFKDSTLLLMIELQEQGHELFYIDHRNLFFSNQTPMALTQRAEVCMNQDKWYSLDEEEKISLDILDAVLMRQDPPFDMNFINNTYVLESAEKNGLAVVNSPSSLRTYNEKLSILNYPKLITDTLVTANRKLMEEFVMIHKKTVIKPLGLMGGNGVQKINTENYQEKLKNVSDNNQEMFMMQRFIDEVYSGDRRILVINGELPNSVVLRKPPEGDFRGNLAIGGEAFTEPLNDRDKEIVDSLRKDLIREHIYIAGLDVVGGFLTEINITCPTCFRELMDQTGENLAKIFVNQLKDIKK